MICKSKTTNYLNDCQNCLGTSRISQKLMQSLENDNIAQVEFRAWTGTDRSTLEKKLCSTEEFVEKLCEKLMILKPHSNIAKQQAEFYEDCKKNLSEGKVLVTLDFSENYKYVVQDASQAFHFNNDQCPIEKTRVKTRVFTRVFIRVFFNRVYSSSCCLLL